jgi:hypothetical protein
MGHSKGSPKRKVYSHSAHIKRIKRAEINEVMLHLKLLEKPKTSRRREIIKIWAKINEIETKNAIQIINEIKTWFFEKINMMDRLLANLSNKRREKTQISKIRNAKEEKITNTKEIQEIIKTTLKTYIPINLKI